MCLWSGEKLDLLFQMLSEAQLLYRILLHDDVERKSAGGQVGIWCNI